MIRANYKKEGAKGDAKKKQASPECAVCISIAMQEVRGRWRVSRQRSEGRSDIGSVPERERERKMVAALLQHEAMAKVCILECLQCRGSAIVRCELQQQRARRVVVLRLRLLRQVMAPFGSQAQSPGWQLHQVEPGESATVGHRDNLIKAFNYQHTAHRWSTE